MFRKWFWVGAVRRRFYLFKLLLACLLLSCFTPTALRAQTLGFNRERGRMMLGILKKDIKDNYYDPTFHGIDLDARFKEADDKIKQADSLGQVLAIIAQVLVDLNDSHTFFLPPSRPARVDYGWQMLIVGDKCFVSAVKPGSDAEAKGLKPGDEIWSIDGYAPTRDTLWKMKYFYYTLRPRSGMRLVIRKPGAQEQQELDVQAQVHEHQRVQDVATDFYDLVRDAENEDRLRRQRFAEVSTDLLVWKLPEFLLTEQEISDAMDKARKHKALIIDLRGNPGGLADNLQRLAGYFFDHDVKIADLKARKEQKPLIAKMRGDRVFKGQLAVLVDSESASAAELFARLVQLEKRGAVLGDRTAGAVMLSKGYEHEQGTDTIAFYGASITFADLIMSDGKSLEHVGVIPDELLLPTPQALAAQHDPVLARAAARFGVMLDSTKAGALFPVEWQK